MQRNEILWTRALLEGGALDPNSGSANPADWDALAHPSCAAYPPTAANLAEAARYTGVQDYDDYDEGANPYFYDPDSPQAAWADWPAYPGLMDRAQLPFQAAGLDVPSYVTNGNHDGLVQGNQDGNAAFEDIATGCFKALGSTSTSFTGPRPRPVLLSPSSAFDARAARPAAAVRRQAPDQGRVRSERAQRRPRIRVRGRGREHQLELLRELLRLGSARGARASASSRSTRSPRAASSSSPRTGTSTTLSSSGSCASCSSPPRTTS